MGNYYLAYLASCDPLNPVFLSLTVDLQITKIKRLKLKIQAQHSFIK
jgi:hypothetical protein